MDRPMLPGKLLIVTLSLLAAGCPVGQPPPTVTRMVSVKGGSFRLGAPQLQCLAGTKDPYDRCDLGSTGGLKQWIDRLSFAPRAKVVVEDFFIDQHEVTNLQYRACVEDEVCSPPAYDDIAGIDYYLARGFQDHPVVWVTLQQAAVYCAYVGKRLPNEAEWEVAGRWSRRPANAGQTEGSIFPWGDLPVGCGLVAYSPSLCSEKTAAAGKLYLPSSVKLFGGPAGDTTADTSDQINHLASNVSEWISGSWDAFAYCQEASGFSEECVKQGRSCPACAAAGEECALACHDLQAICTAGTLDLPGASGSGDMARGGSYARSQCDQRLFVRRRGPLAGVAADVGFRCAR